jgi:hypothetical protein
MAGRAGRRGIDERGVVITMFDQRLEPERAQSIVRGSAARLTSTFHLTYSLMLNAMRTSGIDIEYVILRSFQHFQNTIEVPSMRKRIRELRQELRLIDQIHSGDEKSGQNSAAASAADTAAQEEAEKQIDQNHTDGGNNAEVHGNMAGNSGQAHADDDDRLNSVTASSLQEFFDMNTLRQKLHNEIAAATRDPSVCLPFLCPGRVVRVREPHSCDDEQTHQHNSNSHNKDWGWGAVLGFTCRTRPPQGSAELPSRSSADRFVVDVAMCARVLPPLSSGKDASALSVDTSVYNNNHTTTSSNNNTYIFDNSASATVTNGSDTNRPTSTNENIDLSSQKPIRLAPCAWHAITGKEDTEMSSCFPCSPAAATATATATATDQMLPPSAAVGTPCIVPVSLDMIHEISSVRVYLPEQITPGVPLHGVVSSVYRAVCAFPGRQPPLLDVCDDMGACEERIRESACRLRDLNRRLEVHEWAGPYRECCDARVRDDGHDGLSDKAKIVRAYIRRHEIQRCVCMYVVIYVCESVYQEALDSEVCVCVYVCRHICM